MTPNAQKRTVKRRHASEITYFIKKLAQNDHLSAKAIARDVEENYAEKKFDGIRHSARTVQDLVAEIRARPRSGPWQPWGVEPDDAAVVLGALAELMRMSLGMTTEISQEDAKWIIRLSRAGAGDLPPGYLHDLAIEYQLRGEADTSDLDALIAFAPWRSERSFQRYRDARQPIGAIPHHFPFGAFGDYESLLRRLGFSRQAAALAKSYDDALALEGETPWHRGTGSPAPSREPPQGDAP